MKITKLILGIISIVLFVFVAMQSCAAEVTNSLSLNGETSGRAGLILAFCLLIAGITGIATRNKKSVGAYITGCIYILGAILGFTNLGTVFNELIIWSVLSLAFGVIFILGTYLNEKNA